MRTDLEKNFVTRRPLSWYKEQLQISVERDRLNHSYKRNVLLEVLYDLHEPVSIDELSLALSRERRSSISINTVYRNIKLMVSFDLVVKVEENGTPKYVLNRCKEGDLSIVCRQNGNTLILDAPSPWAFQLLQMLKKSGVNVDGRITLSVECGGGKKN
jgi:Fe2+ or Zn2+ uptake regulation protein